MITQHCKNPACNEAFPLDADHRFSGCCSAECAREMTAHWHHVFMRVSNFMSEQHRERPKPNRVHGRDNRE